MSIFVYEVKSPNFREMRLCMAADTAARLLGGLHILHISRQHGGINFCALQKQFICLETLSRADLMNFVWFWTFFSVMPIIQRECTFGLKIGASRSVWARGQDFFVSRWSDETFFINFGCGWIFLQNSLPLNCFTYRGHIYHLPVI